MMNAVFCYPEFSLKAKNQKKRGDTDDGYDIYIVTGLAFKSTPITALWGTVFKFGMVFPMDL